MPDYIAMFLSAKQLEGLSKETLKYYKLVLGYMNEDIKKSSQEITTEDLRNWLATYHKRKSPSKVTLNNMRRVFSSYFGWLENENYISKSPVRRIHNIKTDKIIKKTLSEKDIDALRENCNKIRDKAIINFLFSTGVRISELVRLNRSDINFTERECVVFGKGNKERVVYFNELTSQNLKEYLNSRKDSNPALFVSTHRMPVMILKGREKEIERLLKTTRCVSSNAINKSKISRLLGVNKGTLDNFLKFIETGKSPRLYKPPRRLQKGSIETILREVGKKIGIEKVHPHKFRRTMATQAAELGMPIEQIQHLLGHVRIDTTMAYVNVNQKNVKKSYREYFG